MSTCHSAIYAIVPASGFSRRMGRQKLLLPWQNKPMLEHVLQTANHTSLKGVLTVIPDDEERKRIAVQQNSIVIHNPKPERGIGFSLALGMKHIPEDADAVVILLGDQPELRLEDIQGVLDCFTERTQSYSKVIVQTQYTDGRIGHPILFSKAFFPELAGLDGDNGGNRIIRNYSGYVTRVNSVHRYPQDIDTEKEYARLLKR